MKKVSLREYDWLGTNSESGYPIRLTGAQVNILGAYERKWAKGTLEWGRDKVRFAGFCGTIKLGTDYFDILPKITEKEDLSIERTILIRMLQVVFNLQLSTGDQTQVSIQDTCILDVFIELFCRTIREAARRGLPHAYTSQAENLRSLRGKLIVSHQIRHNACHPERLFCDYEEFKEDNTLNHILKAALQIAERHAVSPGTRASARSVLDLFLDVSDIPPRSLRRASLEKDRRYSTWKDALTQASWFLEGECPNLYSGKNDSISLLFDMAKLFERYIAIEVRNLLSPMGYTVQLQGPPLWLLSNNDRSRYKMIPDLHLSMDGHSIAILDTKWKVLSNQAGDSAMAQSDLYQVFAYAKAHQISAVALVYPSSSGEESGKDFWRYMDGRTSLHIISADITSLADGRQAFRDHLFDCGLDDFLQHARAGAAVGVSPEFF
jgi:5-methylcytosine-specific restriction enzyme subunit McrC